jgi:L-threonylcarbamoyladenylate synthase
MVHVIDEAVRILKGGGLVAFPTETVYGLGADARNERAVRRIFAVKGRPAAHPLIVHLSDRADPAAWGEVTDRARQLAKAFWPGPLTILVRRRDVPDVVTGGLETVGLRVPSHPMAQELLRAFGGGIAAPSANRFGKVSPTTAAHVREDLGKDVDLVLDGGACSVGVESTIIDCSGEPAILRPGGITREQIERVIGPIGLGGTTRAPGTLATHYAPRARVVLATEETAVAQARGVTGRVVVLSRRDPGGVEWRVLPATAEGVARDLYAMLRRADQDGFDAIVVALPPEEGMGVAIADRLRKAAGPRVDL